ncbi:MAG TPA: hypothetical protein DEP47_14600 [Chloroflexi bacterium]|nr:hypothetical protein [Chloroflexota bacterium]
MADSQPRGCIDQLKQVWPAVIMIAVLLLMVTDILASLARNISDWRNGCQDVTHKRQHPNTDYRALGRYIPAEAIVSSEDLIAAERRAPDGTGVYSLIERSDSVYAARSTYDYLCQNGWSFDRWNTYEKRDFIFGGDGDDRYCTSHAIQGRFYMGYIPLCGSRDKFSSYSIIQRGDVVIAIYETTYDRVNTGILTNGETWRVFQELRTQPHLQESKEGT